MALGIPYRCQSGDAYLRFGMARGPKGRIPPGPTYLTGLSLPNIVQVTAVYPLYSLAIDR